MMEIAIFGSKSVFLANNESSSLKRSASIQFPSIEISFKNGKLRKKVGLFVRQTLAKIRRPNDDELF